ncbi:hypothetical protein [Caenimonas koreensis]|uniref:Dolichyl-phosphate-mannose-protein mannosyltransferase n=1 Tax=Caenimonas koreensis DSM 17982 TaxID=1121255 RepID=A0A844BDR3_9BURK|nr:hypothetical protein [Caenimonas koreensis]MRD48621.1 hypothetical protein [Caenimonas koreensis DSM 17982]
MAEARPAGPPPWLEGLTICGGAWVLLVSIPLALGGIGITWDGLNHHLYLGWTAQHQRFDRDVVAASYQVFQFPYANWPLYKLALSGVSGPVAGVFLASVQWLAVPAVWMIACRCIPGRDWFAAMFRAFAVVLAFSSGLVLSFFDSTINDLIACIPLMWAVAFSLPIPKDDGQTCSPGLRFVALAGLLAGASVALKLSNGPVAAALPVIWSFGAGAVASRWRTMAVGIVATGLGFTMSYSYWGWLLWEYAGNPVYPFCNACFQPVRDLLGWKP